MYPNLFFLCWSYEILVSNFGKTFCDVSDSVCRLIVTSQASLQWGLGQCYLSITDWVAYNIKMR